MIDLKYWIWFSNLNKIGNKMKQRLLEIYKEPEVIWNLNKEELLQIEGMKEKMIEEIQEDAYRIDLEGQKEYMQKNGIGMLNLYDKDYPKQLKQLYDKPVCLYYIGDKTILQEFSLAMIGCRENTSYGETVANYLAQELGKRNIITISGLARGIDSITHMGSLKQQAKTIAVIGSGFKHIYPSENKGLAKQIVEAGGCILTEYGVNEKPERMHFPARNRIISGLSQGVIVIEAKKKSGTMITVDFALEQGKNVFAVPGNITSNCSQGTNYLISQGAKVVTSIDDILEEYRNNVI